MSTAAERLSKLAGLLQDTAGLITVPAANVEGSSAAIVWNETPTGTVDGTNAAFTLAFTPTFLLLYKNGLLQRAGAGNDYTISGSTVTFEVGNLPQTGDILLATYPH